MLDRKDLLGLVKNANSRVRVLGTVAFNLPYDEYREDWLKRISAGLLKIEIICESESLLSYSSLISINKKVSGEERSYNVSDFLTIREAPLKKLREYLVGHGCENIEPEDKENQCFSLRTSYLPIPVPTINIDDDYYITFALTNFCDLNKFEKVSRDHYWWNEFQKYFKVYFDDPLGARKCSTEVSARDDKTEVIVMYNDNRHVLGQLPRDAFLNTTKVKVVVWGMLFSRDGKVLIHKRKSNAKDNRDLWDKSIGGHVDLEKDTVDTSRAAAREMVEELYKFESEGQGHHSKRELMKVDEGTPVFLGDWRPEIRYTFPLSEIRSKKDKIFFFRLNYDFSKKPIDSPRIMPDDSKMAVKCCPDVYAFVMNEGFEDTIDQLENSEFKLLELHELNDCHINKEIEYEENGQKITEEFKVTPDLQRIIDFELWDELTTVAAYLKEGRSKE